MSSWHLKNKIANNIEIKENSRRMIKYSKIKEQRGQERLRAGIQQQQQNASMGQIKIVAILLWLKLTYTMRSLL